jgi:hypothetical protein
MGGTFNPHREINTYKNCAGKPEGRCHSGDRSVDGMLRVK